MMKSRWPGRITFAAIVIAIVGAFAWALREQPVLVDVATVTEAPMQVTIREEGMTRVREIYTVSTPIAGHLSRTVLKEGDKVTAGESVVAAIHPLDPPLIDRRTEAELLAARDAARSAVGIAEVELQKAETAMRLADQELQRAIRLFEPGVIPESALERAQNQVELSKAAVDAAKATISIRKAELASAEARLIKPDPSNPEEASCCINLYAPVDGVVLKVHAESEQAVSAGAPVAEIGDVSDLEVVVDLLSADAVRIAPGTRAIIRDWGGEDVLTAVVRQINPAAFTRVSALGIEEQRVNAVLDLESTDERLGHGFRVIAELVAWECEKCLQVPISALFRARDRWTVFVVNDMRLRSVPVRIGRMNDEYAQILEGLAAGDRVVVHPSDEVEDGTLIEVRDRAD